MVPPSEREAMAITLGADDAIDSCKESYWKTVLADGPLGASPLIFPYTSANAITAQVTIAFGLRNESVTITSGPQSFLKAVASAYNLLRSGISKAAITGGFCEEAAFAMLLETGPRKKTVVEITRSFETPLPLDHVSVPTVSIAETFREMVSVIDKGGVIKSVDNAGRNMILIEICVNRPDSQK